MTTFLEAYKAYRASPANQGKSEDDLTSEFVEGFKQKTGRNLSEFTMSDQIPDFAALDASETEAANMPWT